MSDIAHTSSDLFGDLIIAKRQPPRMVVRKKNANSSTTLTWVQQEMEFIFDAWESLGLPEDFADKAWQIMHEALLWEVLSQFKDGRAKMSNIQEKWNWITAPLVPDEVASYMPLTFQACCLVVGIDAEEMQEKSIKQIEDLHPYLPLPSILQRDEAKREMQCRYMDMRLRLLQHTKCDAVKSDILRWIHQFNEEEFGFLACCHANGFTDDEVLQLRRSIITSLTTQSLRKAG